MKNHGKQKPVLTVSHKRRMQTVNVEKLSEVSSPSREMHFERKTQFRRVTDDCETSAEYQDEDTPAVRSKCHSKSEKYVKTTTKYLRATNECYSRTNKSAKLLKSKHAFERHLLGTIKSTDSLSPTDFSDEDYFRSESQPESSTTNAGTRNVAKQTYGERQVEMSQQFELKAEYKKEDFRQGSGEITNRGTVILSGESLDFDRNSIGNIFEDDIVLQEDVDTEGRLENESSLEMNNISRENMLPMSQCLRRECRMETKMETQKLEQATLPSVENISENTIKITDCPPSTKDSNSRNSHTAEKVLDKNNGAKYDNTLQQTFSRSNTVIKIKEVPSFTTSAASVSYPSLIPRPQVCCFIWPRSSQSNELTCCPDTKSEREVILHNYDQDSSYHMVDADDDCLSANESERCPAGDHVSLKSSISSTSTYVVTERNKIKESQRSSRNFRKESAGGSEKNNSLTIHQENLIGKSMSSRTLEKNANLPLIKAQESKRTIDHNATVADAFEGNSRKESRLKLNLDAGLKSHVTVSAKSESSVSTPRTNQIRLIDRSNSDQIPSNITQCSQLHLNAAGLPKKKDISCSTSKQPNGKTSTRQLENSEIDVGSVSSIPEQNASFQVADTNMIALSQSHTQSDADADREIKEDIDLTRCTVNETPKVASKSSLRRRYTTMSKKGSNKSRRSLPSKQTSNHKVIQSVANSAEDTNKCGKKDGNCTTVHLNRPAPQTTQTTTQINPECNASTYYVHQATSISNENLPADVQCTFHSRERCLLSTYQVRNINNSQTQIPGNAGYKSTGDNSSNISSNSGTTKRHKRAQHVPDTQARLQAQEIKLLRNATGKSQKIQPPSASAVRPSVRAGQLSKLETLADNESCLSSLTPRSLSSRGKARSSPPASPRMAPCYSLPSSLSSSARTWRQRQEDATKAFLSRQKAGLVKKSGNLETKETSYKITFPPDEKGCDGRQLKQGGSSFDNAKLDESKLTVSGEGKICSPRTTDEEYFWKKAGRKMCIEKRRHDAGNSLRQNCVSLPSSPRKIASDAARTRSCSPHLRRSSPLSNKKGKKENAGNTDSRPNEKKSNAHAFDISQESQNNTGVGFKDGFSQCCSFIQVKRSFPNVVTQAALDFKGEKTKNEKTNLSPPRRLYHDSQMEHVSDSNDNSQSTDNEQVVSAAQISVADRTIQPGDAKDNSQGSGNENLESLDSSNLSSEESYSNCSSEGNTYHQREPFNVERTLRNLVDENLPNEANVQGKTEREHSETVRENISQRKLPACIDHRLKPKPTEVKSRETSDQTFRSSGTCSSNERSLETSSDARKRFLCNECLDTLVESIVKKKVIAHLEATLQSWGVDGNQKPSKSSCNPGSVSEPSKQVQKSVPVMALAQHLQSNPPKLVREGFGVTHVKEDSGMEANASKQCSIELPRTIVEPPLELEAKSREVAAQKPSKLRGNKLSEPAIKKPEIIQLFPTLKPTRAPEKKREILTTMKTKRDLTHKELKYTERAPENEPKKRKAKLSESTIHSEKVSSKETSTCQDISSDKVLEVVKKRFFAMAPNTYLERHDQSRLDMATGKKRYSAVDDEYDLIPTKEKRTVAGSIKGPLCLFGCVTNNPELRHVETSIDIYRNNPKPDTDKTRKNDDLSSERSRRKILAESKTSEDEGEKIKSTRTEAKKKRKSNRSAELESGAMPVLRNVEKTSDARSPEGLSLVKTLWAASRISFYNDGSRTYEVMKPETESEPDIVFAVLP